METQDTSILRRVWQRTKDTRWATKLVCICLLMALISCIGASLLQTSFGAVEIIKIKIPTTDGTWLSGRLYKPTAATGTNKVPLVVTLHGLFNDNNMQDITGIELARRGIGVIAPDGYYHGDSSSSIYPGVSGTLIAEATGIIPMVEFAYSNLNWVDNTKIGVQGHSMGGVSAFWALYYYGAKYSAAIKAAQAPISDGGTTITAAEQAAADAVNKIAAGFPTGASTLIFSFAGSPAAFFANIHANVGADFAYFDEGGYTYPEKVENFSNPANAPESLAIINSVLPADKQVTSIVIGKYYGDAATKTLRVIYNPREIHPWEHFSTETSADSTEFFTKAFQMTNPIPSTNQVWLWKEIFNCLGLVASFLIIVPLGVLLLKVPVFASLNTGVPQKLPALSNAKSRLFFWGMWILSWVVSYASLMPISKLDKYPFKAVTAYGVGSRWFGQPITNLIMLWAVFNGLVGLLLFWLNYQFYGKKNGVTSEMTGIKTSPKEFLKTLGLAVCIVAGFYSLVLFAEYFFGVDFRIWTIDITTFSSSVFLTNLQYLPLFFIFFAANAIAVNGSMRVAGQKEWLNLLIIGLGNVLGIIILETIQYWTVLTGQGGHYQGDWLRVLVLVPLIPYLFIAAYVSRYLFKATGKVWLGAMVNTMIIVSLGVGNTVSLIPFK